MAATPYFQPSLFTFLKQLKKQNEREWFQANKGRFESEVRDPLLRFIADFAPRLHKLSPHFVADPRANGGSMFRIHRDVRFSLDKSPYKTHAAAQFRHARASNAHTPCFYLHLEPGQVFIGAGIWHPDSKSQQAIRQALLDAPDRWRKATTGKAFQATMKLEGESRKRPPVGVDPEHPLVEDLMRKDFIAVRRLEQKDACAPDFLNTFTTTCKTALPMVALLGDALSLDV